MYNLLNQEKIDSGSNYNFPDKMERPRNPRSLFNLSHLVSGTMSNAGLIIPLTWFEYLPGDSIEISLRHLIRVMPQVVPLLSRQRLFVHAFAMDYTDLQSDFKVLATNGYNGRRTGKKIAPLTEDNLDAEIYDSGNGNVKPCSLADYLGLPQGASYADLISRGITCLPFLMYESIYKHYYMNKNYYMDNQNWLPDDDETFRVNELGVLASNTDDDHPKVYFGKLHYRDYPMDYFTSGLPFAQRGDRPTLPITFEGSLFDPTKPTNLGLYAQTRKINEYGYGKVGTYQASGIDTTGDYSFTTRSISTMDTGSVLNGALFQVGAFNDDVLPTGNTTWQEATDKNGLKVTKLLNDNVKTVLTTNIGVDNLREMIRQQVELEKMARTDGSFNQWVETFFGRNPHTPDCRPRYIGGYYSQISFTEVLQTSQSSVSSALGQIAGHGISVENNGYVGRFETNNFGLVMVVATIMPDIYYSQGLEKKWTRRSQSELYLPERAKMGLQPIKNEEIFFQGSSDDNGLFAYQNPFDDLRYMQNKICGKIADATSVSFYPYTQARKFETLPTLSQSFAVADDVRKDYLFATEEDAYLYQFAFNIRAARELPYKAIPNNFGF